MVRMDIKRFDYRIKPHHEVRAIRFDGSNYSDVVKFLKRKEGECELICRDTTHIHVKQHEGIMRIDKGDFIVQYDNGDYYPFSENVFYKLYKVK